MAQPVGTKDYNQFVRYLNEQQSNLRRYAQYETRTRDQQLAPQRGQLETILQALDSIASFINCGEYYAAGSVTESELSNLAREMTEHVANARKVLNQPFGKYQSAQL
ncbi:MAG: hypothetical protein WC551_00880 [Patescibacteria group bacterium]